MVTLVDKNSVKIKGTIESSGIIDSDLKRYVKLKENPKELDLSEYTIIQATLTTQDVVDETPIKPYEYSSSKMTNNEITEFNNDVEQGRAWFNKTENKWVRQTNAQKGEEMFDTQKGMWVQNGGKRRTKRKNKRMSRRK